MSSPRTARVLGVPKPPSLLIRTAVAPAGSWIVRVTPGEFVASAALLIVTPVSPSAGAAVGVTAAEVALPVPVEFVAWTSQVIAVPTSALVSV